MKIPEGGPEQFFVLTDRSTNGPPTMVFFKVSSDAWRFAGATDRREGWPTCSTVHSIVGLRSRANMRAERETEWAGIGFRPCPYCGKALSCHDVEFLDEEGCTLDDYMVDSELFVSVLAMGCDCGSAKVVRAEAIRWPEEGWRKRFADAVNARAEVVRWPVPDASTS